MTKSITTLLKLFQWLLINLAVTMAGLQSLPFRQALAERSLCSATEGQGELLPSRQAGVGALARCCGEKRLPGAGSWLGLAGGQRAEASTASTQAEKLGWHQTGQHPSVPGWALLLTSSPLPVPSHRFPCAHEQQALLRSALGLIISLSLWPHPLMTHVDSNVVAFYSSPSLSLSLSFPIPPIFMTHEVKVVIILYLHGLSCLHHLLASK